MEVGMGALERWRRLGEACAAEWTRARGVRSISPACALREWRWLAWLRLWRLWAAGGGVGGVGDGVRRGTRQGEGSAAGERRTVAPEGWDIG